MQVCTDRSLSQRRREQNLRTPTTPTPIIPKSWRWALSLPAHLSASKPGTLLTTQIHYRAQRQCNGAFCFGKLYNPFYCPTLNSPTGIIRKVGKNQSPFPLSQVPKQYSERLWWCFLLFHPCFYQLPSSLHCCDSLLFSSSISHCRECFPHHHPLPPPTHTPPHTHLGPSVSKALPKCLPTAVWWNTTKYFDCSTHWNTPLPPPLSYDSFIQTLPFS